MRSSYSAPAAVWVSVTVSSAASASSAAFTVTVCAVLQFDVVKVIDVLSSETSLNSAWPLTVTVTEAVGTCESFTV